MIESDLIVYINNFIKVYHIGLLNKDVNRKVDLSEKSKEWFCIYNNYFIKQKISFVKFEYDHNQNWKRKYVELKNAKHIVSAYAKYLKKWE